MNNTKTSNIASFALGAVLILAGIMFLVGQFIGARFWDISWPFTILIPGLLLFIGMVAGGKSAGGLAVPASIVTTLGLLMLFQNTFNYFESWAYAWALIPTAAGAGMIINGMWSEQPELVQKGQNTARVGMIMFAIGFVFFELVLRIGRFGGGFLGGFVGPLILIAIGGYLLFRNLVTNGNELRTQASNVPTIASPQQSFPAKSEKVTSESVSELVPELVEAKPIPNPKPEVAQRTEPSVDGQEKEKIAIF